MVRELGNPPGRSLYFYALQYISRIGWSSATCWAAAADTQCCIETGEMIDQSYLPVRLAVKKFFLGIGACIFLAQPLAVAANNEPERNAEVLFCANKLEVSPHTARSRTHISRLYSCISRLTPKEAAALTWDPGFHDERVKAMSNCIKAYERESLDHSRAYLSGKRYALFLERALQAELVSLRSIYSRDDLFSRARLAYNMLLGHVPSDPSFYCVHATFGFTGDAWSGYHSGFSEHLSPSLKRLFWSLPER